MDRRQLFDEALRLPSEARAALAGELIQSLDDQVDEGAEAAWVEEIRRRVVELQNGVAKTVPWAEARRRILLAAGLDPHA